MSQLQLIIGNKNYSSWSLRAWLLAKHAGLAFSERQLDLTAPDFKTEILTLNPAGKVPALVVDGCVIWDSLAIAEYLAELCPELWPDAALERARARSLCAEMHAGFLSLRGSLPMNVRAEGRRVGLSEAVQHDIQRILAIWRTSREQHAGAGPWLFGRYSVVDAMYAPVVLRFRTYGISEPGLVAEYMGQVTSDPCLQAWLEDAAKETSVLASSEVGQI